MTISEHEVDKHLPLKLKEEASGILNRLLDGLRLWIEKGIQVPADINETTEHYRRESDLLGRFLQECVAADDAAQISNGELYELFTAWAKANGEALWRKKGLTRAMQERGYVQSRNDERYWSGIRATKSAYSFGEPPDVEDNPDEIDAEEIGM